MACVAMLFAPALCVRLWSISRFLNRQKRWASAMERTLSIQLRTKSIKLESQRVMSEVIGQTEKRNRQFVLAERPVGVPTDRTLRFETVDLPTPQDGQMLLRTVFLSLDPYMRGRMSDAPSYAPPVAMGAAMVGGREFWQARHSRWTI